jgi:hypothetical protein
MLKKMIVGLALASCLAASAAPGAAQVGVSVRFGAPPPPRVERIPVAPGRGYFWRPGHWNWDGGTYVWIGGSYIARPYRGAVWVPGHFRQGPRGYHWVEGHWR